MKVLVIIPAYNEEANIDSVVRNITVNHSEYDYVVINDGSRDETQSICMRQGYNHINLPLNLGIGGAVQTGYAYANQHNYEITIQMDGDGQHDPMYITSLIKPIIDGNADMVIGSRFLEKEGFQTSFMRRFGIKILRIIIWICCGYRVRDATSGFRASSKRLTHFFCNNYAHDYPEPEAIVSAVLNGYSVIEVPVKMNERRAGISSINGFKSVHYMLKVGLTLLFNRIGTRKEKND